MYFINVFIILRCNSNKIKYIGYIWFIIYLVTWFFFIQRINDYNHAVRTRKTSKEIEEKSEKVWTITNNGVNIVISVLVFFALLYIFFTDCAGIQTHTPVQTF